MACDIIHHAAKFAETGLNVSKNSGVCSCA